MNKVINININNVNNINNINTFNTFNNHSDVPSFVKVWQAHSFEGISAHIASKTKKDVENALHKAHMHTALNLDDLAALLSPSASGFLETMAQLSQQKTVARFGKTIQLYAPMYLTNICANICTYCGFSANNKISRKALKPNEMLSEAHVLKSHGFDHVLLVTGEESRRYGVDYLDTALKTLRPLFSSLSIEIQPLSEEEYTRLSHSGLSTVLVYQETYDKIAYQTHHIKGPKSDMAYRLDTPDRLGRAGIKKIGLGALYGLSDWRAESWFIGLHLQYLEQRYWQTRYSISFPRIRPHEGDEMGITVYPFEERELLQVACAFRLFNPEVELSLSTRENSTFRNNAFNLGFTSMSAGSCTNPGGYALDNTALKQFDIDDERSPNEVAALLMEKGYTPVWKDWDASYDA